MKNKHFLWIVIAFICSATWAHGTDSGVYDGKWWLSVDKNHRAGFVDGYIACYAGDVKGKIKFVYTGDTYAPRLTDYLNRHPEEAERSVEELLWKMTMPPLATTARERALAEDGTPASKYGLYDGEFWRESPPERLGIIQGFLYCYSKYGGETKGKFSKPASAYVRAISEWYGIEENDESAINLKKMNVKIPCVLFKFRDADTH